MTEKLRINNQEQAEKPRTPADRFRVEASDYPIFRRQAQLSEIWGDNSARVWNIDKTLSEYVTQTANMVSVQDGSAELYEDDPEREKPDHVIYLDKSARPVSWLVNLFWDDFAKEEETAEGVTKAERPSHSYLNVDRLPWFREAGLEMDAGGYVEAPDGSRHRPGLRDFMENADKIPEETFARIRALFIPGGVETEDLAEIRKTPTALDGKNVLVVDEVADTGATLGIAKYILSRAIPEIKSINGEYFWNSEVKTDLNGLETQGLSVPVWYSHHTSAGRGIGDINEAYFQKRYEENPTRKTRAQAIGALALSEFVDLGKEEGGSSRELAREMRQMHEDYQAGKILLKYPMRWEMERAAEAIEAQGLRLAPPTDKSPDTYANVRQAIEARPGSEF